MDGRDVVKECELTRLSKTEYPDFFANRFIADSVSADGKSEMLTFKNPNEVVLKNNYENEGSHILDINFLKC